MGYFGSLRAMVYYKTNTSIYNRIKATLGITGWSPFRVPIDEGVLHLDVGSSRPMAVVGHEGWTVHPLKRYVI